MMKEKHEEMAVMKGVTVGLRDVGQPCLWFEAKVLNGGALQVLGWDDAAKLLKDADVYELKSLEGRPCKVEVEGNLIRFLEVLPR